MKTTIDLRTAVVLCCFMTLGAFIALSLTTTAYAQSKVRGWEYDFRPCGEYNYQGGVLDDDKINKSAAYGWELVPLDKFTPASNGSCLFRRQK